MFELPTSITIGDQSFPIRNRGDFRMVLDCFTALNDDDLDQTYRIVTALIIFYDNMVDEESLISCFGDNLEIAVNEMLKFFNCGREDTQGAVSPYKLVDWEQDSQLIAAAVNNVANTEIRALDYLHWWTFMGYYLSVGECSFSTVVSIRHKIKAHKKLEKYEIEFKNENPQYFIWDSRTDADKSAEELLAQIWNKE